MIWVAIAFLILLFAILITKRPEEPRAQVLAEARPVPKAGERYAVNLDVDFAHLYALATKEKTLAYIEGRDDHGEKVEAVPISATSSRVWFDFASAGPEFAYERQDVPLAQFVCQIAYTIRDDMIPRRNEFEKFLIARAEDLVLKRIAWDESLQAWHPTFEVKSRRK